MKVYSGPEFEQLSDRERDAIEAGASILLDVDMAMVPDVRTSSLPTSRAITVLALHGLASDEGQATAWQLAQERVQVIYEI